MVPGSPAAGVDDAAVVTSADAEAVLRRSAEFVAGHRRDDAIELLSRFNRRHRDPAVARQIIALRNQAYGDVAGGAGPVEWPPTYDDAFAELGPGRIPEIDGAELSSAAVGAGLLHHGSLLVRNLVDEAVIASLVADIDHALESAQRGWGAPRPSRRLRGSRSSRPRRPFRSA